MGKGVHSRALPAALLSIALVAPASAGPATTTTATVLTGTVYLPGRVASAAAAAVDLVLAHTAGLNVPGAAFARGVTGPAGEFAVDPPERPDLVAAALANGGSLPVGVRVTDLTAPGALDGAPDGGADVAVFDGVTVLRLVADAASPSGQSFALPSGDTGVGVGGLTDLHAPVVRTGADVVLQVADAAKDRARVAAVFMDPDLVAGNDDPDDPDLVPPLGAVIADAVPLPDIAITSAPARGGVDVGLDPGGVALPTPEKEDNDTAGSCGRDAGTQWVSERHGNNIEGTKTYVYLDTYSCTKDSDGDRDEVVYKWGGYTGSKDKHWTIYRLKFRTEIAKNRDYYMKHPDPVGDTVDKDGGDLTWHVGFDYFATAGVSGNYRFRGKKIHGWQADGTGRLYHVSWINNAREGAYGEGFRNGGGVNLDVPQGSNGRDGVANSVIIWRCWWPDGYDGSDDDGTGRWRPQCDE